MDSTLSPCLCIPESYCYIFGQTGILRTAIAYSSDSVDRIFSVGGAVPFVFGANLTRAPLFSMWRPSLFHGDNCPNSDWIKS